MNDQFAKRVSAAAGAAWWTVLILMAMMMVSYGAFLLLIQAKPDWMLVLWGGGKLTWDDVHRMAITLYGAFKIMVFVFVGGAILLTLWGRKLRKIAE